MYLTDAMKIVLAYNVLDSVSGETVFFNNMINGLSERGFKVSLCPITMPYPRSLPEKFDYYSRLPLLLKSRQSLKKFEDHDVLHFLNFALAPVGGFLKNRIKIATTHFTASSYFSIAPPEGAFARHAESLYCRYVSMMDKVSFKSLDCLVACSPYQAEYIKSAGGIADSKVSMICPGIDVRYLRTLPKRDLCTYFHAKKIVLYLGRLHERSKGISYLIRAMKHIRNDGVKLLICGDGPDRSLLETLVKKEGISEKTVFLGRLDFKTKSIIQKSADVIVMPSLYEVFGTVFAESIALGRPVIAFDIPFWKGLYEGAGVFVRPKDEVALANAIDDVLENPRLRHKLASEGRSISDRYDVKKTVGSYVKLYEGLCEERGQDMP
jgi:glycosyltransferase involved in cell wall biosynthesis